MRDQLGIGRRRAPVVEEAAKGAFLLLMMTGRRRNELNSLTDCLVYAGLVGAGFAWLEDILYIAGGESLGDSLLTAGIRLIMGPFAHSLFTTMFGLGVWFALQQRNALAKAGFITLGYLAAIVMHGLWNGSSLLGVGAYFAVYVFWMVPMFALAIVLGVRSRRREQRVVAEKLPGMVSAGLVSPNEATWLGSIETGSTRSARRGSSAARPRRRRSGTSPPRWWSWRSCVTGSTAGSATSAYMRCKPRRPTRCTRRGPPHPPCRDWPGRPGLISWSAL